MAILYLILLKLEPEGLFTRNEIQPVIRANKKRVARQKMAMFIPKQFRSVYQSERVADPFALKLYSVIQNHIGPNFNNGLNFVTMNTPKR